ncbi:hypothetical protein WJX81_003440 [Elliptochloris bilobata]|uniref:Uncharacterized protein n=1 Tax=Elliptochloris bilobata TaxID=381761 RepID=A0AAW1QKJ6_9CHLO
MLAAFADVPGGAAGLRSALLTGVPPLDAERLALLAQITPSEQELMRLAAWLRGPGAEPSDLAPPEQALAALGLRALGGVPRPRAKASAALFRALLPGLASDACAAAGSVVAACAQVC